MKKIILGLIIMIVLMGTAAAVPDSKVEGVVYDENGGVNGATVTAYSISYTSGFLASTMTPTDSLGPSGNYELWFDSSSVPGGTVYLTATTPDGGYGKAEFDITECSEGCSIIIYCQDIYIPEFPTIALPVAAIIGLVFIFQRRREEE